MRSKWSAVGLARDASSVAASWRHTSTLSVVGGPASLRVDSAGADHSCSSNLSHPPFLTESLHGSTVSSASTGDGEQCSSVAGFCTVRGGACANFVSASSTSAGGGEATLQGSAEREENRGRDACKLCERGGKQLTCTAALVHCEGPTARLLAHSTAAQAHTVGLACANSRRAGRAYLPTWAVNDADQQQLFERHLLMNPKSRRSHRTREQLACLNDASSLRGLLPSIVSASSAHRSPSLQPTPATRPFTDAPSTCHSSVGGGVRGCPLTLVCAGAQRGGCVV
jgi:hypothetical protein